MMEDSGPWPEWYLTNGFVSVVANHTGTAAELISGRKLERGERTNHLAKISPDPDRRDEYPITFGRV